MCVSVYPLDVLVLSPTWIPYIESCESDVHLSCDDISCLDPHVADVLLMISHLFVSCLFNPHTLALFSGSTFFEGKSCQSRQEIHGSVDQSQELLQAAEWLRTARGTRGQILDWEGHGMVKLDKGKIGHVFGYFCCKILQIMFALCHSDSVLFKVLFS